VSFVDLGLAGTEDEANLLFASVPIEDGQICRLEVCELRERFQERPDKFADLETLVVP
jgi:hypothetical protein